MKKYIFAVLIIFLYSPIVFAQVSIDSVLKDGIGVRPLGMGGAFTAVANDSNCIYYNPGGLGFVDFSYTIGYQDLQNANFKLNNYNLFAYKLIGAGNWHQEDFSGNIIDVTAVSLGSIGSNMVGWGFTTKHIAGNVGGKIVDGSSMDIGLKAPLTQKIFFGLVAQDIFKNNLDVKSAIRAGIAYETPIGGVLACDAELSNLKSPAGMDIFMHYGYEMYLTEGLLIRVGWQKDKYCAGATASLKYFTADFAAQTYPYGGVTQYMMSFRIGR